MIDAACMAATYAAVELGSDGFRLYVGEVGDAGLRLSAASAEPIRLGSQLDGDGCLTPAAMKSALGCLRNFRAILQECRPRAVRAVATSALRVARNADVFLPAAAQALGHPVEIISAAEEGRLVYLGVAAALGEADERRLVLDLGTGATRMVLGRGLEVDQAESFGAGVLRHSLAFFPGGVVDAGSFAAAFESARGKFIDAAALYDARHWHAAYGASAVIRNIAKVVADNGLGDGRLSARSLDALRERLVDARNPARLSLAGLHAPQATHLAGAVALLAALVDVLAIDELLPMQAGLRAGAMWDLHRRSGGAAWQEAPCLSRSRICEGILAGG
jgi:exopolyphosphatase/guanosine-5'-triphosphate,3'-diphosphate pyrophosphatase